MPIDDYGKMRCCEYYPVSIVEYDEETGKLQEEDLKTGFIDDYLDIICYDGNKNEDDSIPFTIDIPQLPELENSNVYKNLEELRKSIQNKVVQNED